MSGLDPAWSAALAEWAAAKPKMLALYAFGSRVKRLHRPDSDLDLALQLSGSGASAQFAAWVGLHDAWAAESAALVGPPVHLEWLHQEWTEMLWPVVMREGVLIYRVPRGEEGGQISGTLAGGHRRPPHSEIFFAARPSFVRRQRSREKAVTTVLLLFNNSSRNFWILPILTYFFRTQLTGWM